MAWSLFPPSSSLAGIMPWEGMVWLSLTECEAYGDTTVPVDGGAVKPV
jgi:hypothetical protein